MTEMNRYPKYKVRQLESIAWLFTSLMKIDLDPVRLSIIHGNKAFMHRFTQLIRLGRVREIDLNTSTWQLSNPTEILFLLRQIQPHIHTRRENNIAKLLVKHLEHPDPKTEKLKDLVKMHNIYFFYFQILS